MTLPAPTIAKGLEGIVIAETAISDVNGSVGTLEYRGFPIRDLALQASFEEIIYLLWNGELPNRSKLETFNAQLAAERALPDALIDIMQKLPNDATPMAAVRTAFSALGMFDSQADDNSVEANKRKAVRMTASMSTIVAAWERIRNGQAVVAPRADLSLAANFLYMLSGKEATEAAVRALNIYLVLLADHGMNASTFAARVTTSTLSDMWSAITSAIGTLKGAVHGGANEMAMRQFIEIGDPENVDAWFDQTMTSAMRIMGIGHRVYKTGDPRMFILKDQAKELADSAGDHRWYEIATRLEGKAMSHPYFMERKLFPNVEYYSAIVLYQTGIPVDQFTPMFAISRTPGWCAHILEQWQENRLIRPDVVYTGLHNQTWLPLEAR
jgi:citrate synthase